MCVCSREEIVLVSDGDDGIALRALTALYLVHSRPAAISYFSAVL